MHYLVDDINCTDERLSKVSLLKITSDRPEDDGRVLRDVIGRFHVCKNV